MKRKELGVLGKVTRTVVASSSFAAQDSLQRRLTARRRLAVRQTLTGAT